LPYLSWEAHLFDIAEGPQPEALEFSNQEFVDQINSGYVAFDGRRYRVERVAVSKEREIRDQFF